jgi:hypothetical protein
MAARAAADAPSPIASARVDVSKLAERIAADAAIATGTARIVFLQVCDTFRARSAKRFVPDLTLDAHRGFPPSKQYNSYVVVHYQSALKQSICTETRPQIVDSEYLFILVSARCCFNPSPIFLS